MSGPAVLNASLISGALDMGAVGMSNLVTMWDKARGSIGIRSSHDQRNPAQRRRLLLRRTGTVLAVLEAT